MGWEHGQSGSMLPAPENDKQFGMSAYRYSHVHWQAYAHVCIFVPLVFSIIIRQCMRLQIWCGEETYTALKCNYCCLPEIVTLRTMQDCSLLGRSDLRYTFPRMHQSVEPGKTAVCWQAGLFPSTRDRYMFTISITQPIKGTLSTSDKTHVLHCFRCHNHISQL